jgi:hypothetical protein
MSTTKHTRHIRSLLIFKNNMQKDLSEWIDVRTIEINDTIARQINKSIIQE